MEFEYEYSLPLNGSPIDGLHVTSKKLSHADPLLGQRTETWTYTIDPYMTGAGLCSNVKNPDGGDTKHCFYSPHLTYSYNPDFVTGRTFQIQQPDGSKVEHVWGVSYGPSWAGPYLRAEVQTPAGATTASAKEYVADRNGNVRHVREYDEIPTSSINHTTGPQQPQPVANLTCPNTVSGSRSGSQILCADTYLRRTTETHYVTNTSLLPYPMPSGAPPASETYEYSNAQDRGKTRSERSGDSASETYEYSNAQDNPEFVRLLTAPSYAVVTGTGPDAGPTSTTTFAYDGNNGLITGNIWKEIRSDSATGTNPEIVRTYKSGGDIETETDARGIVTTYVYGQYGSGSGHPYPTSMCVGSCTEFQWDFGWDKWSGLRTSEKDTKNNVSISASYELRGRIACVKQAEGDPGSACSGGNRLTVTAYDDSARTVTVTTTSPNSTDGSSVTRQTTDDLGRVWKTEQGSSAGMISEAWKFSIIVAGEAPYDLVTNPFTPGGSTSGWTRTKRDRVGRVLLIDTFSGSGAPALNATASPATAGNWGRVTMTYSGNQTTVTDEGDKARTSYVDGLGRLVRVDESDAGNTYTTTYDYDALDKLVRVTQGTQVRTFQYSSLGLLTRATNPEYSGATPYMSYTYDSAGNLKTRTDPRGAILCMGVLTGTSCAPEYNALNQPLMKQYSTSTAQPGTANYYASTPNVDYTYGNCGSYSVGRLCSVVTAGVGTTSYTYDSQGHAVTSTQAIVSGGTYPFTYTYSKLNDALSSITYPSSRTVSYVFDPMGRVNNVINWQALLTYAGGITYAPHGGLLSLTAGNGLTESRQYNVRLQPSEIAVKLGGANVMTLGFDYGTASNNGNVRTQTITRLGGTGVPVSYTYDGMNRLKTGTQATGVAWSQTFDYDRWGNRALTSRSGAAPSANGEVPTAVGAFANNRITAFTYDNAGNVTNFNGVRTAVYDAENRQVTVTPSNGERTDYVYDGEGRRIKKITNPTGTAVTTTFVYDAAGQLAAEYGGPPLSESGTRYLFGDHLGSTRLVAKATGTTAESYVDKAYDYLPFGEEIANGALQGYPTSDAAVRGQQSTKFTGHLRDAETGLDFFGARYFSAAQGRFTSADPLMASATVYDPQTWNRYSYGRNNPLKFIDPTGMAEISAEQCQKDPQCVNVKVNVIYDRNANGGDGLSAKQRAKFEQSLLANAKDEYGNSKVRLDVSYSAGGVDSKGKIQGAVKGSINVIVSDSSVTLGKGVSQESEGELIFV